MMIPGGLSSEASFKDARFIVQTEFAQIPKPRVTTTVSLNGEVVEKVENVWERLPQTEEDKQKIERFLKQQHQQVLNKIKDRSEKPAPLEWEEEAVTPTKEDVVLKLKKELAKTAGVLGWVLISKDDKLVAHHISPPETKKTADFARRIKDFSLFLPSTTKMGNFVGGILKSPGICLLFFPFHTHFLVVKLDPKVDFKDLVKKVKSVV